MQFYWAKIYLNQKDRRYKTVKIADFDIPKLPKLISRKIPKTEKFFNFHTVLKLASILLIILGLEF